jgi:oligosaccharide translocation protein RFT1
MASPPSAAAPPPPALGGLRALMLLQLSTRAVSVLLAQFLVRIAPPAVFAAAHIHLDLLLSTLLFLAREGVRGALLRAPEDATAAEASAKSDGKSTAASAAQHVAQRERARQNVALLPLVLGAAMLLPAFPLYARLAPASLRELASFRSALALYLLGAALELLAEPLHTRALSRASDTGNGMALRVRAEGAAVLSRCAATAVTLYVAVRRLRIGEADAALLAFACGQAAYGGGTLGVYLVYFLRAWGPRQVAALFTPSRVPLSMPGVELASSQPAADSALLDKHAFALAATMTRQSFLKHLLTEADRIAVARLATLDNQGAYALAGNYGECACGVALSNPC